MTPSIVNIAGTFIAGLGLFFVGLWFLTEHLRTLGGRRLRERIARWTRRPVAGVLWGSVFIAITQSTSATMFVLVGMMRAGMITVAQSMPMMVGVNMAAGLVILVLVLDVKVAILFLLGLSGLFYTSDKTKALRSAIGTVFGISLLFFGLSTMQAGVTPLTNSSWFTSAMELSHGTYFLALIIGAILSVLIQSSLAVIAIAVALQQSGLFDLDESIMVVYGANIGSSIVSLLLSSRLSGESKQIAMFQIGYNFVGAAILIPLFYLEVIGGVPLIIAFIEWLVQSEGGQVAVATLISDFVPGVFLFIFRKPVGAILARFWPETFVEQISKPKYLHDHMAEDPDTAMDLIGLEQRRLVEHLDDALGTLRIGAETAKLEAYQEAFSSLDAQIGQAMSTLSTNGTLSADAFHRMNNHISIQQSLQSASEILGDLQAEFVALAGSPTGARFVTSAVEGLEAVLLTLIDVAKDRTPEDAQFLEMMTSDDGNGLTAVRSAYLDEASALDADARMKLLAAANLCERLIWLFGSMGRRFMATEG